MKDKIYTLNSGVKIYVIDELAFEMKKYVFAAVVDSLTGNVTEQVVIFEYFNDSKTFNIVESQETLKLVAQKFAEKE